MKAFVVHKAEPWNLTVGSLFLLFKEFGYRTWLNPRQIENYDELNHNNPYLEQEVIVGEDIAEMIRIGIFQKKLELLKYKKGLKLK